MKSVLGDQRRLPTDPLSPAPRWVGVSRRSTAPGQLRANSRHRQGKRNSVLHLIRAQGHKPPDTALVDTAFVYRVAFYRRQQDHQSALVMH
jgi:hypothetical protein